MTAVTGSLAARRRMGAQFAVEHLGVEVGAVFAEPAQRSGFAVSRGAFNVDIVNVDPVGLPTPAVLPLHRRVEQVTGHRIAVDAPGQQNGPPPE